MTRTIAIALTATILTACNPTHRIRELPPDTTHAHHTTHTNTTQPNPPTLGRTKA